MILKLWDRSGVPPAAATANEHDAIKKIGRLVLYCAGVLLLSATLLVATALQVVSGIDEADLRSERLRAANAIDAMVRAEGPLSPQDARFLGQLAGLREAQLTTELTTDPNYQQMPLLGQGGESGTYLTWRRAPTADAIFRQFAPIRLPIIGGMLTLVLGMLLRLRHLVGDIERQRRLAYRQSRTDVVTGLANRLALETALAELAGGRNSFAIVSFDLDRFKSINDAFGHAAGDEVLRTVGLRLSGLLEPGDVLARLGGDEFVILCTSRTAIPALAALAQLCITVIEQPIELKGQKVQVGVSMGIVPAGALDLPAEVLLGAADAALYRAKSMSGSAFSFAGDAMAVPKKLRLSV